MKGIAGSSVQFNWSFSGDVSIVKWGLTARAGAGTLDKELCSISKFGSLSFTSLPAYAGRVSVLFFRVGNVIFTLSKLETRDTRFYGCNLIPTNPFGLAKLDNVKLVVEGE